MFRARFLRSVLSLAAVAAWFGVASPAAAQDEAAPEPAPPSTAATEPPPPATTEAPAMRYPVARAERPLTLAKLLLVPLVDLDTTEWPVGRFTNASVGAAFGVVDDLTVRATVAPLQLTSPNGATGSFHYGQLTGTQGPSLGATYRFLRGDVELGAALGGLALTAYDLSGYRVWGGVPVRAHLGKSVRLDTFPELAFSHETNKALEALPATTTVFNPQGGVSVFPGVAIPPATTNRTALLLPLDLTWSVSEPIHVGVSSGYVISDLSDAKNTGHVPVGVYAGYTVAGERGPILDVDPYVELPGLFYPGRSSKKTQTDWNIVGVTVRAYVDLL